MDNQSITGIIYKTTNLINGKIYVGQTIREKKDNYYGSGFWIKRAISKYGLSAFSKETLEEVFDWEILDQREIFWIEALSATNKLIGYNISPGGFGKTRIVSEETRKKISQAKTGYKYPPEFGEKMRKIVMGRPGWNKGKKMTEEFRKKVSDGHKGQIPWILGKSHTDEAKLKISKAGKGRVVSEDTRKKMINSQKNRPPISYETKWKKSRHIKCIETGEVFMNAREAVEKMNFKCCYDTLIWRMKRGKETEGFHFEYIDDLIVVN